MTRRHLLLVPSLLAIFAALAVPSIGSGQSARTGVNGTWRFAGAPADGEMIVRQAVEPVVGMLRADLQPVARERIAESTWLPTQIRIGARGTRVQVALNGQERRTFTTRAGAPSQVALRTPGQYATLTQTVHPDGSLEQVFVALDGTQRNVYVPGPNGTMVLDVTLESPVLRAPIHFQLDYRRGR
jgi:hypothetical protein